MKKRFFLASVIALGLMAGCSNDEYEGQDIAGSKLVVSASIDEVKTRMNDTTWAVGDAIGVSNDFSTPSLNIKYVAGSSTGDFTSSTGIYLVGESTVNFTAYYPFNGTEGTAAGDIDFSIADNGQYVGDSKVDFLFATATASREKPTANFQFKHVMSRLKLTITGDETVKTRNATEVSYTLKGVITDGTFNTGTGVVTAGKTTGSVKVTTTLGTASSVILPPSSSSSSIELMIEIDGKVYTGSFSPALQESNEYSYSINLSETESGTKMQISSASISGFQQNNGGTIGVKEEVNYNPSLEVGDFICADGTQVDKEYNLASLDAEVKKSIVGVVYYVGDATQSDPALKSYCEKCTNGLAVALTNANESPSAFASARDGMVGDWLNSQSLEFQYHTIVAADSKTPTPTSDAGSKILGYNHTKVFELSSTDETLVPNKSTAWNAQSDKMIAALTEFRKANKIAETTSNWYLPSWKEMDIIRENYNAVSASIVKAGGALDISTGYEENQDWFYWTSVERNASNVWGHPLMETTYNQYQGRSSAKGYFRFAFAF